MSIFGTDAILNLGSKILDKIFPDPEKKAAAQIELIKAQQSGALEEIKTNLSAIIAEANSADPYTSRARPSFLYVVYILILFSIPMGILSVINQEAAAQLALGTKSWLEAIPEHLWTVFGFVMGGYITGRTMEKIKGIK